jgi:hypothetical protein
MPNPSPVPSSKEHKYEISPARWCASRGCLAQRDSRSCMLSVALKKGSVRLVMQRVVGHPGWTECK